MLLEGEPVRSLSFFLSFNMKSGNYIGSKRIPGVYQKIINLIPEHQYYIEPFAGSGAIGLMLPACTVKHFNDLDALQLKKIPIDACSTVIKTCTAATDILQSLSLSDQNVFAFIDPPYIHSTRSSSAIYNHEMTQDHHETLLTVLQQLPFNVMVVHPVHEMYDSMLSAWWTIQLKIRYHKKTSLEKLYMNYPPPTILQSYKYLGSDCWVRQRIKRKAARFLSKGLPIPFPGGTYIEHSHNLSVPAASTQLVQPTTINP